MRLARVAGTVVSTIASPILERRKLLLCDLVEPGGAASGGYLIAVDTVGAGVGELVLLLDEGTSARQIVGAPHGPLRCVVVGIVDDVHLPPEATGRTAPPARRVGPGTPGDWSGARGAQAQVALRLRRTEEDR